jgi:hypothetical protein
MNGLDSSFAGIPHQLVMQDEYSPTRSLLGGRSTATNTGGFNDEDIDSKIMENV